MHAAFVVSHACRTYLKMCFTDSRTVSNLDHYNIITNYILGSSRISEMHGCLPLTRLPCMLHQRYRVDALRKLSQSSGAT
jgi:hypothetical protein